MPELFQLPGYLSETIGWLLVASSFATSLIAAVFGLGGGTMLLALLAIVLPPVAVIPIHGIVQLGSNLGRTALMRKHVQWTMLLPFTIGTAFGSVASGWLFSGIPDWLVQYAVALFIAWSVLGSIPALGKRHIVGAGAVSGFLTMLFGATGPFVSAFFKTFNLAPLQQVGTHAAAMSVQHCIKVVVFGYLGFSLGMYAILVGMMLVSGFIGTAIGRHLLGQMPAKKFRPILNLFLLALAAQLAWQATVAAFPGLFTSLK